MSLDLNALRPAYNGTAAATAAVVTAPYWAHVLADIATVGDGTGPLGATAIALAVAALADRVIHYRDRDGRRHDLWVPRVAVFTVAIAPLYSLPTAHTILTFLTGAAA